MGLHRRPRGPMGLGTRFLLQEVMRVTPCGGVGAGAEGGDTDLQSSCAVTGINVPQLSPTTFSLLGCFSSQ